MCECLQARVHIDYHIDVHRHFYSVPYILIGQSVDVRLTQRTVEVLREGERVTSHVRSLVRGSFTTLPEHRPPDHDFRVRASTTRLLASADKIGPAARQMFSQVMAGRAHEEQGYRACLGLLNLGRKHGAQALEAACLEAIEREAVGYRNVAAIITEMQAAIENVPAQPVSHANIRGPKYYQQTPDATERKDPCCSIRPSVN
jgi:hypothetical protein